MSLRMYPITRIMRQQHSGSDSWSVLNIDRVLYIEAVCVCVSVCVCVVAFYRYPGTSGYRSLLEVNGFLRGRAINCSTVFSSTFIHTKSHRAREVWL